VPFDEARRLALAVGGLDVDELARARVVERKAGTLDTLCAAYFPGVALPEVAARVDQLALDL